MCVNVHVCRWTLEEPLGTQGSLGKEMVVGGTLSRILIVSRPTRLARKSSIAGKSHNANLVLGNPFGHQEDVDRPDQVTQMLF